MATFLTGATGYIGSYLAAGLSEGRGESLNLLVRAKTQREAEQRLWQSLQLHHWIFRPSSSSSPRASAFFAVT